MKILNIIGTALLLSGLTAAYFSYNANKESQEDIEILMNSLEEMGEKADSIVHLKHQKSKLPREIKSFDQANIIGFIENKASQSGISKASILRMNPSERVVDKKSGEVELKITITLKKINLKSVYKFLYSVENAGIGLTTTSLRFDKSSKKSKDWNVQTVISCFIKRSKK